MEGWKEAFLTRGLEEVLLLVFFPVRLAAVKFQDKQLFLVHFETFSKYYIGIAIRFDGKYQV